MTVDSLINKWVAPEVRSLKAYSVADSTGLIKLDAMESSYSITDTQKQEWLAVISQAEINRYPDPNSTDLKQSIKNALQIPSSCNLMLGNGSDELIQIIAMLMGGHGKKIMAPTPSFSMYQQISVATSTQFCGVALNSDYSLNLKLTLDAIDKHQPSCVFLAYPNNPTGNCFSRSDVESILKAAPGMVVLDEAYNAFCGKSFVGEIETHPNLVVLRTLSKTGLAGLRLGILAAGDHWINEMEKLRLPYNLNVLTQLSGHFFMDQYEVMREQSEMIIDQRSKLYDSLNEVSGIVVYPSETNFLLFKSDLGADRIYKELVAKGILVKNLHGASEALANCLRVTVSNESENLAFLEAISSVVS